MFIPARSTARRYRLKLKTLRREFLPIWNARRRSCSERSTRENESFCQKTRCFAKHIFPCFARCETPPLLLAFRFGYEVRNRKPLTLKTPCYISFRKKSRFGVVVLNSAIFLPSIRHIVNKSQQIGSKY